MNSITDSTYTTQEKLQILADAAKYDVHVLPAVLAAGVRKESSAMRRHAVSATVLLQTEGVFLC